MELDKRLVDKARIAHARAFAYARVAFALLVAVLGIAGPAEARSAVPAELPSAIYVDTEVSTNVPFVAALDVAGRFAFNLSCRTTSSNNVEVAFGTDANANGVLDLAEIDRVVGWDCGVWFTRRGADGVRVVSDVASSNVMQTLAWSLQIGSDGQPSLLSARVDGMPAFAEIPLESSLYCRSWNLLRLTGRGLDAALENFSVSVTPDGTAIIMR